MRGSYYGEFSTPARVEFQYKFLLSVERTTLKQEHCADWIIYPCSIPTYIRIPEHLRGENPDTVIMVP